METMRLGRNDLCRCGSGKKYKKCCLPAVPARITPPRPVQRDGQRMVFHQTPAEMAAAREQALIPVPQPQRARPTGRSSGGGETIEATGGHPFWVISGEDLDKRPVPQHCPAEVPNSAIPGRWVNAIDLRIGDVLFTRDGRRVPVTHVSVRHVKTTVYNLQVAELENYAVGHTGMLVHNTSGTPVPQLTPGQPRQMLGDAVRHVKSLPRDAAQRADAFEALAKQIETHSGGAWSATRGKGTDGSIIFLGRQGEGLVVVPDGRIFRGAIGRGIDITPNGLCPNAGALTPLD